MFVARREPRRRLSFPATLVPIDVRGGCARDDRRDEKTTAIVLDISSKGMGLLASARFERGETIVISIDERHGPNRRRVTSRRGVIVDVVEEPSGFRLGISFEKAVEAPSIVFRGVGRAGAANMARIDPAWGTETPEMPSPTRNVSSARPTPPDLFQIERKRLRHFPLFQAVTIVGIALDQITKASFLRAFRAALPHSEWLPRFLTRTPLRNSGALGGVHPAASWTNYTNIIICLLLTSMAARIAYDNRKRWRRADALGWGLFLAGTAGNLIDRIYLGYVRDFIRITAGVDWYLNLADLMAVCGVLTLIVAKGRFRRSFRPLD